MKKGILKNKISNKDLLTVGFFKSYMEDYAEGFAVMVKTGFDNVDSRFDQIDSRFDRVDQRFTGIDQRLDKVERRLNGVEMRLGGIDRRLDDFAVNYRRKKVQVRF